MNPTLLNHLTPISDEEQAILNGDLQIRKDLYTDHSHFIIESRKILEQGDVMDIRTHTRFIHFPKHRHNYVEIIYMCQGSTTHIINEKDKIILNTGELLFLNQNVTQEILPASFHDIAVNFIVLPEFFNRAFLMLEDENVLREFLVTTLQQKQSPVSYLHFQVADVLPVQNLVENLIWSVVTNENNVRSSRQITMGLLFLNLLNHTDRMNQNNPDLYHQNIAVAAMRYIENNYRTASLEEFAGSVNLPAYQVSRLLSRHIGHTFKDLLQKQRLNQTAYLLIHTSLSLEVIMSSIGYNNSSYFYRLFRDEYGMTPKEFRLKNKI
ncbi:MAG: helix-turn-helix domain-containing protein [Lachnospiraceae bacterium]